MMKQYCPNSGGDYKNIYDKINILLPKNENVNKKRILSRVPIRI